MNGKEVKEEEDKGETSGNGTDYNRAELPDLLRIYYSRLFPYDKYYDWLEYGEAGPCRVSEPVCVETKCTCVHNYGKSNLELRNCYLYR